MCGVNVQDKIDDNKEEKTKKINIPTMVGLKLILDSLSGILYFIKEGLKILLKEDDEEKFEEFRNKIGTRFYAIVKKIVENNKIEEEFTLLDLILAGLGLAPLINYMRKNHEKLKNNAVFAKLEKKDKFTSFELIIAFLGGESVINILEKIVNFRTAFKDLLKLIIQSED